MGRYNKYLMYVKPICKNARLCINFFFFFGRIKINPDSDSYIFLDICIMITCFIVVQSLKCYTAFLDGSLYAW